MNRSSDITYENITMFCAGASYVGVHLRTARPGGRRRSRRHKLHALLGEPGARVWDGIPGRTGRGAGSSAALHGKARTAGPRAHGGLRDLVAERTGYVMQEDGGRVTILRTAPPQGADDWTHEPGGADNRFASSDRLVKWPLGVLWYSGDTDRFFTPATHFQHERNPYPLVIDGRMFIITGHYLHAVDIYTGLYLWKAEMPRTPWIETYYFDTRQYGRATERHCALAHDLFYAVTGDTINAYDTQTGKLRAEIGIPDRFRDAVADSREMRDYRAQGHRGRIRPVPAWTEVRLHDDPLFAVFGKHLAALDRHSGAVQWSRESTRVFTTYAIGDGTFYGMDYGIPKRGGDGKGARSGLLFALAAATGDVR